MESHFDIVGFLRYNCQWKGSTWECAVTSCSFIYVQKLATQTVDDTANTLSVWTTDERSH